MSLRETDVIRASSASAWRRPPPTDRAAQEHVSTVSLRTYRPTPAPRLGSASGPPSRMELAMVIDAVQARSPDRRQQRQPLKTPLVSATPLLCGNPLRCN